MLFLCPSSLPFVLFMPLWAKINLFQIYFSQQNLDFIKKKQHKKGSHQLITAADFGVNILVTRHTIFDSSGAKQNAGNDDLK